jgi:osmotically-inducible protein OsmY
MGEQLEGDLVQMAVKELEHHLTVPPGSIQVVVRERWLTLDGTVDWEDQQFIAESMLRRLHGVNGITNHLKVRPDSLAAGPAVPDRKRTRVLIRHVRARPLISLQDRHAEPDGR